MGDVNEVLGKQEQIVVEVLRFLIHKIIKIEHITNLKKIYTFTSIK